MECISVPKNEFNDIINEVERLCDEYEADFQAAYSRGFFDGIVQAFNEMGFKSLETMCGILNLSYNSDSIVIVDGEIYDLTMLETLYEGQPSDEDIILDEDFLESLKEQ